MSLGTEETVKIRLIILRELQHIFAGSDHLDIRTKIAERLHDAVGDEIAIGDPSAAEVHRKLRPEDDVK